MILGGDLAFAGAILGRLFVGDGSFFGEHDGDIVAHRIHAAANRTLKPALIGERLNVLLADWTDQHFQQILGQGHMAHPSRFFWDCSREHAWRANLRLKRRNFSLPSGVRVANDSAPRTPYLLRNHSVCTPT